MHIIDDDAAMFISLVALAGFIAWLIYRRLQQYAKLREMQIQLFDKTLERFGTIPELMTFMQSPQGEALFNDRESNGASRPRTVLRFIQFAVILLVIAVGFFVIAARGLEFGGSDIEEICFAFDLSGVIAASMGVGLAVVALVTYLWERWSS